MRPEQGNRPKTLAEVEEHGGLYEYRDAETGEPCAIEVTLFRNPDGSVGKAWAYFGRLARTSKPQPPQDQGPS
jgi:hypothetical protein